MASEVSLLGQSRFQTMCGNTNLHIESEIYMVLLKFLEMSFFFKKRERERLTNKSYKTIESIEPRDCLVVLF